MLRNVQALRALAAISVVIGHLGALGSRPQTSFVQPYRGIYFVVGVDMFFVISGFIMIYITRGDTHPGRFILARVARIYPLWWAVLVAAVPATLLALIGWQQDQAGYLIRSFFLLPSIDGQGDLAMPAVNLGWTLIYEMFFYLVFAAALATGRRLLVTKVTAVLVLGYALHLALPASAFKAFLGTPVYFEFVLGMAVARLYLDERLDWRAVALLGIVAASIVALGPDPTISFLNTRAFWWGIPAAAVLAAALLLETGGLQAPRAAVILGNASYATYLVQFFTLFVWPVAIFAALGPLTPWAWVAALILTTQVLGVIVYFAVDRPLHTAARSLVRSRTPALT